MSNVALAWVRGTISKPPNVSNILKKVLLGFEKKKTLVLGENEIIGDLAASSAGRIFTLRLPGLKIGPNDDETQFFLFLAPTFVNVMLHDPDFFILNFNPFGLPTVTTVFDAATMFSHYHRIALTEIQELDLPTDPCNDDQSYNFNSCVRRSLARQVKNAEGQYIHILQVGCKTLWDRWNGPGVPNCTTGGQYR